MNKVVTTIFAGLLLATNAAPAQDAAPASNPIVTSPVSQLERLVAPLNGISSLIVAEPSMIDTRNASDCKLDSKLLRQKLLAALVAERLPLAPDNAVPRLDLLRVTLKAEVATLKDGVVNCVSWVSLTAQLQDTLKLALSPDRKPVSVIYWTRGALIMTPVVDHATGVADVYDKLVRVLARQWRIDNPANGGDPNRSPAIPAGDPMPDGLGSVKR